jgi:hypothetical protein
MAKYLLLKRRAERPSPGQQHPRTSSRSFTDFKERKVMDPHEIIEERQDRTGLWVGSHEECTLLVRAGGRS